MIVNFHTCLDEVQGEVNALNRDCKDVFSLNVPREGERIRFEFERSGPKSFDLEVVNVVYLPAKGRAEVELHIPKVHASKSIAEWTTWFNKHRHGREW